MKKKRITYGVSGMMEYQSVIRFGKNSLKVTFTGGSMNAIGITPATFTTNNFLIQQAIENSNDYKRGRIYVVKSIDLGEEVYIERNTQAPAEAPAQAPKETVTDKPSAEKKSIVMTASEGASASSHEPAQEVKAEEQPAKSEVMTEMEFSCNDDAKDYLEQKYGYVRSKLRNREDIVKAGENKGIKIIFI